MTFLTINCTFAPLIEEEPAVWIHLIVSGARNFSGNIL